MLNGLNYAGWFCCVSFWNNAFWTAEYLIPMGEAVCGSSEKSVKQSLIFLLACGSVAAFAASLTRPELKPVRRILLPTLLLLATAAIGGTTYTVARNTQDHGRHHHGARIPVVRGAGHVQTQPGKAHYGQDQGLHAGRFTLASNAVERDHLSDVLDGERHDHSRLEDQIPGEDYSSNGPVRTEGSADTGGAGVSHDGDWSGRFASFGGGAMGAGGGGGYSGASQNSKPGQGADAGPSGDN